MTREDWKELERLHTKMQMIYLHQSPSKKSEQMLIVIDQLASWLRMHKPN